MAEVKKKKPIVFMNSFEEEPPYIYWLTKLPIERLAALEQLRSWMYDNTTQRIQKILTITHRA